MDNNSKTDFEDLSRITKGGAITLAGMVAGKGIFFFYAIFLAHILSAEALGIYFLGVAIVTFLAVIANLGLNSGATRFIAIHYADNDLPRVKGTLIAASIMTTITSCIIAVIVFFLADRISVHLFHKPELSIVLKILSLSLPLECLMRTFVASTMGLKLVHHYALIENIVWTGLRFVLSFVFLYFLKSSLIAVSLAYFGSSLVAAVIALFLANAHIPLFDKRIPSKMDSKILLNFAVPMAVSEAMLNLRSQSDVLMLGILLTSVSVGVYSIAVRLITLAGFIYLVFMPIFNPYASELHHTNEFEKLGRMLKVVTRWNVTISFPVFLCLLVFGSFFLRLFGTEFVVAYSCLAILVISNIFSTPSALPSSMIFMIGRSDLTLKNNISVLALNVCINFFLIRKYGIVGSAIGTGVSSIFLAVLRIIEIYKLMGIHPFSVGLWKPIVSGLITIIPVLLLNHFLPIKAASLSVTSIVCFLALYTTVIYWFGLSTEDLFITEKIKGKLRVFSRPPVSQ